jgi:hypothetical protein
MLKQGLNCRHDHCWIALVLQCNPNAGRDRRGEALKREGMFVSEWTPWRLRTCPECIASGEGNLKTSCVYFSAVA